MQIHKTTGLGCRHTCGDTSVAEQTHVVYMAYAIRVWYIASVCGRLTPAEGERAGDETSMSTPGPGSSAASLVPRLQHIVAVAWQPGTVVQHVCRSLLALGADAMLLALLPLLACSWPSYMERARSTAHVLFVW